MRLLGTEGLQAARSAAAGRFYQIGMGGDAGGLDVRVPHLSGACHWDKKHSFGPPPVTRQGPATPTCTRWCRSCYRLVILNTERIVQSWKRLPILFHDCPNKPAVSRPRGSGSFGKPSLKAERTRFIVFSTMDAAPAGSPQTL